MCSNNGAIKMFAGRRRDAQKGLSGRKHFFAVHERNGTEEGWRILLIESKWLAMAAIAGTLYDPPAKCMHLCVVRRVAT